MPMAATLRSMSRIQATLDNRFRNYHPGSRLPPMSQPPVCLTWLMTAFPIVLATASLRFEKPMYAAEVPFERRLSTPASA